MNTHHPSAFNKAFNGYSLLIICLCAGFQFYKYLLQVYPSIITVQLMKEFNLTGAELGNLTATFYYSFIFVQLFVGILLDRFGTRLIASIAILSSALGVLFFSQSHSILCACLSRGLIGASVAFSTITYIKLTSIWVPNKYYAFVNGLLATATMTGVIFSEIPLSLCINELGWRACLLIIGLMGLAWAILFFLIVRDTSNLKANHALTTKTKSQLKNYIQVFTNTQNWLLLCYGGLTFAPISVFGGLWGYPFLQQAYQLNKMQAGTMISLIFLGLGLGSPIIGIISGYLDDRRNIMFYSTLLSCVSISLVLYCLWLPLWLVGVLLFTFGFALGGYLLAFVLGKELNSLNVTATVVGMINIGDALLTGITEPAIGKLLDMSWDGKIINGIHYFSLHSYQLALTILPLYMVTGSVLLLRMKVPKASQSGPALGYKV